MYLILLNPHDSTKAATLMAASSFSPMATPLVGTGAGTALSSLNPQIVLSATLEAQGSLFTVTVSQRWKLEDISELSRELPQ